MTYLLFLPKTMGIGCFPSFLLEIVYTQNEEQVPDTINLMQSDGFSMSLLKIKNDDDQKIGNKYYD